MKKITYRGVSYNYNPPTVTYGDSTQVGKYRGLDIRFRAPKQVPPVLQPTLDLVYRGIAYPAQTERSAEAVQPVEAKKAASIQERARVLMMNHHRMIKQREQSMLSRLDAEVGLPASEAGRYWNHIQGKAHPTLGESYDRSPVALS